MPPSASKRLQVIEAVVTVLRGMADANVYFYPVKTPASVTDDPTVDLLTANGVDVPFYKVEPVPEGRRNFYPAMQVQEFMIVNVQARMDADQGDDSSRAKVWENLGADIERALGVDITLGGLVYDVRVLQPMPVVIVGSSVVILVQPLEIRLHRTYGAP